MFPSCAGDPTCVELLVIALPVCDAYLACGTYKSVVVPTIGGALSAILHRNIILSSALNFEPLTQYNKKLIAKFENMRIIDTGLST